MIDFTDQPSKGLPFGYAYYSATFRTGYLEERNVCAFLGLNTFPGSFLFLLDSPCAVLIEPYLVLPRSAGQKRDVILGYVQHSFGKTRHVSYVILTKLAALPFESWPVGFRKIKKLGLSSCCRNVWCEYGWHMI